MRLLASLALAGATLALGAGPASAAPPIKHVFIVVLENKDFESSFGQGSQAPYLAGALRDQGQLLTQYYGTGHLSLGNYITMVSGQAENPTTQSDCQVFMDVAPGAVGPDGQALGTGCVYPAQVETVADQLEAKGLTWRGYMEDMGNDPAREAPRCAHPAIGASDKTQSAQAGDQYATRHNPFVYFHSIIDDQASCDSHVVPLSELPADLATADRTPNYTFITPDLCSDGHDDNCVNPSQKGGYEGIDEFLRVWAPRITGSPAFADGGLLLVTFDESESGAESCCFQPTGPNTTPQGIYGPGGGRTGTLAISPYIRPGTSNDTPYNHYSLLRSVEDLFGLPRLGYAARPEVTAFGDDVFNRPGGDPCLQPNGHMGARSLDRVVLGRRRAGVRQALGGAGTHSGRFEEYCLAGGGELRVAYLRGRAALVLTSSTLYGVTGLRPGDPAPARRRPLRVGGSRWYLFRGPRSRLVARVRGGVVREVGLAATRASRTPRHFLRSLL